MRRALSLLCCALLAACGGSAASSGDRVTVVTALYPLAFVAEEVAGNGAEVIDLTPPGVEPHDLELTPSAVGAIAEADLVVYLSGGLQPAVEDALEGVPGERVLDGLAVAEPLSPQEQIDPHVWLDPLRLSAMATALAERLGEIDPDNSANYRSAADRLEARLSRLDDSYRTSLDRCARHDLVVSHEAFAYIAQRYGLDQIGIAGLDPEAEPSPQKIAEVAEKARARGVTTIFFETLVSPDIAETLASELGVEIAELNPIETEPSGGDYFDAMRANLDALTRALDCE